MKKLFLRAITIFVITAMLLCLIPISAAEYLHEEHTDLATEAVTEGIVLLKNSNQALPLASAEKIAVFGGGQIYTASTTSGYQIGGGGSGWVNASYTPQGPVDALLEAESAGKISVYEPLVNCYLNDVSYIPDEKMYNDAAAFAGTAVM